MASGQVANFFKLQGPNNCTTTACASGTHAIGDALLYIQNGYAKAILCGGSESTICDLALVGFNNMKALSKSQNDPKSASKPFDKKRDGFVLGEGCGTLILEDLEHALNRNAKIYAEVIGFGLSADAYHITKPPPYGEGAQRCIKLALNKAKTMPSEVDYINAHGTSTQFNDLTETQAIEAVFENHAKNIAISSTKGVTGHCLGAAGGIEGVFLAKTIETQTIAPTANLTEVDESCTLNYTAQNSVKKEVNVALSNSFGFGGTNASIVMKKFKN